MRGLFPYAPEALENTQKIADRCNVEIEFGVTKLPKYDVPEGYTSWEYLNELCHKGLEERYSPVTEELKERLKYELSVIHDMGYVDYFSLCGTLSNTPGTTVSWWDPGGAPPPAALWPTAWASPSIDPIRYQLLFERFLNPERVSMPDIDVDFCFERRQEVIDYVVRKYGSDRVVTLR